MLLHSKEQKERLKKLLTGIAIAVSVGLLYYLVIRIADIKIPCIFYTVTGLYCPGCGVTRMILALLRFDFVKAFYSHPVLFCIAPFLAVCFGAQAVNYVKSGKRSLALWQNIIIYSAIFLLVAFCIVKNLFLC